MKSYHVDVEMKFTVPAYGEEEARDAVLKGFAEGRYAPARSEILVDGFAGKDPE